jgi:hypothetical protein
MIDRVERDHIADHRIGAAVSREGRLDRGDRPVLRDAQPSLVVLVAVGCRCQEVLAAHLDPLHRALQAVGDRGYKDVLRIDVTLGSEAAAHVGSDDPHLLLGKAQGCGDGRANRERHLRRGPHREPSVRRVGLRHDAARLDRHRRDAGDGQPSLDDRVRLREAARDVTDRARRRARDVVGPFVEDPRRTRRQRRLGGRDRRQRLVSHLDRVGAIGGPVRVVGEDHGDRLARVAHLRPGDHRLGVGAELRRRHEGRHRGGALGQIGDREDRDDARKRAGSARVHFYDARMGVRAPHDRRMDETRQPHVVHEAAAAGEEAAIFAAFDGQSDRRGHRVVAV